MQISAKNIIIATGSTPKLLPPHFQALEGVFTSDDANRFTAEQPASVIRPHPTFVEGFPRQ